MQRNLVITATKISWKALYQSAILATAASYKTIFKKIRL